MWHLNRLLFTTLSVTHICDNFLQWFPNYKGLVNGFIVAGFGGGAFVFDFIQTAFINPLNVKAVNASVLNTTQDIGDDKYVTYSAGSYVAGPVYQAAHIH